MDRIFTAIANRIAHFVGDPLAFVIALMVVVGVGRDRADLPLFGYVAAHHQYAARLSSLS